MKNLFYILVVLVVVPSITIAQTSTENYIKNTSYKTPLTNAQIDDPNTVISEDDKIESITYIDGLGSPKQTTSLRAGGQKQDIIQYIEYDGLGREVKQYLPYATIEQVTNGTSGDYIQGSVLKGNLLNFFNTAYDYVVYIWVFLIIKSHIYISIYLYKLKINNFNLFLSIIFF